MTHHRIQPAQLVELTSFDTAFAVMPGDEDDARRRYMTLLVDDNDIHQGASSTVYQVHNTECTSFALKVLRTDDLEGEERDRVLPMRVRTFTEEYRAQAAVSHLAGFPKLYGFGMIDDVPAILMEWICGPTLREAMPQLPSDVYGRVEATTVAGVGIAVLNVLKGALALDEHFVHRDLSPKNILLRCDHIPLEQQIASKSYDVCLVDLGSASIESHDASLTLVANIWRNGTPDYAPPEMLSNDLPNAAALRSSRSIDIYALCSILYELYAQTTPFGRGAMLTASPYHMKMTNDPLPLVPRDPDDAGLTDAIMAGLERDQDRRIRGDELMARLEAWIEQHGVAPRQVPTPEDARTEDSSAYESTHLSMPVAANASDFAPDEAEGPESRDITNGTEPESKTGKKDAAPRSFSRRTFIAGIAAGAVLGAGAVALGGAAVATKGFGLFAPRSLDDWSWDELADLSARISAAESDEEALEIAREAALVDANGHIDGSRLKSVTYNGIPAHVRLVGIAHDELANGTGKAGLTFMFDEVIATKPMNDTPLTTGAWEASDMRPWLNGVFSDHLDAELTAVIKPVVKYTNNVGGTEDPASVTTTEDSVWLFSYCELVGARERLSFNEGYRFLADILNTEGTQYAYFREQGVMPQSNHPALIRNQENDPDYWWLRTPSPDVSLSEGEVNFNRVGPNGDPFHFATNAAENAGVVPGFCV